MVIIIFQTSIYHWQTSKTDVMIARVRKVATCLRPDDIL